MSESRKNGDVEVDEAMAFVERSLERDWTREPSEEEIHDFDQAMKRKLKHIARRADHEYAERENAHHDNRGREYS